MSSRHCLAAVEFHGIILKSSAVIFLAFNDKNALLQTALDSEVQTVEVFKSLKKVYLHDNFNCFYL